MDQQQSGIQTNQQSSLRFLDTQINLRQYWHIILERRWLVITAFLSVLLVTAIYLFRAKPIFASTVRVQIDRDNGNVLNVKDGITVGDSRETDYLQTQYKNLQGRTLVESMIATLKLDTDPRYARARDIVGAVKRDISVLPIRLSRLVDVTVEHTNPNKAQLMAKTLGDLFVQQNLDQKLQSSLQAQHWLEDQVVESANKLTADEKTLAEYRERNVSLEDTDNIVRQALLQAQSDLSKARTDAQMAATAMSETERLIKEGHPIESIPAVSQSLTVQRLQQEISVKQGFLAGLLERYRNKHPAVLTARSELEALRDALKQECRKQLEGLRNQVKILKEQENQMFALVEEEEERLLRLVGLRIEYDVLKREVENSKAIYNTVLLRLKEVELTGKQMSNNIFVRDQADLPLRPVKPRVVLTLIVGVLGGLGVSLGLAFFVNYLDDSIKSQDDVENDLRLPFLGYVPNIKANSVVERDLQAHLHPQSNAAESFRTVRATISLTHKPENFRVLAVSSTIPSEGKSLVASNLAIVHAQTGLKTLLVDADLRRPSVHKAYQLHSPVGLSAFLSKQTDNLDDIVHHTEVKNLDAVCCGSVPSNPSELIGSARMMEFIERARGRYDRVIMDCPPISAVSDPLVIAAMSDGIVYVTKFNKIRREHGRKSVARIQNAGIHILGLIINDIDFEGKDSYYYSYYYYQNRYYASHYKNTTPTAKEVAAAEKKEEKLTKA
jgi:succinoglycan biosynthesis transport protein ExoP